MQGIIKGILQAIGQKHISIFNFVIYSNLSGIIASSINNKY